MTGFVEGFIISTNFDSFSNGTVVLGKSANTWTKSGALVFPGVSEVRRRFEFCIKSFFKRMANLVNTLAVVVV